MAQGYEVAPIAMCPYTPSSIMGEPIRGLPVSVTGPKLEAQIRCHPYVVIGPRRSALGERYFGRCTSRSTEQLRPIHAAGAR